MAMGNEWCAVCGREFNRTYWCEKHSRKECTGCTQNEK